MIGTILSVVYIAALSAGTSYFLNFAFGFPLSDNPNPKAVFFKYSVFLARWSMKRRDPQTLDLIKDEPLQILLQARGFWTWEYAAGMCAVCSNVWLTIILYIFAVLAFPTLLKHGAFTVVNGWAVILLSHIAIRKYLLT